MQEVYSFDLYRGGTHPQQAMPHMQNRKETEKELCKVCPIANKNQERHRRRTGPTAKNMPWSSPTGVVSTQNLYEATNTPISTPNDASTASYTLCEVPPLGRVVEEPEHLEMLLPELEVDLLARRHLARLLDIPSRRVGTAEVHSHVGPQRALETAHICPVNDAVAHAAEQASKVWTAEVGAGLEFREGILVRAHRVEDDILRSVGINLLREIGVDAQELVAFSAWAAQRLCLERGEERLEPFKRVRVFADPDEFHAAETLRRVRAETHVVDGLEDRGPGCDTNTGTDEHGDFVLEDVLSGRSVRSVDAESGHLLTVLQRDFVHAHGIELVVELGLRLTSTEGIGQRSGKVTNLADVDGDIRVLRARSDGKRMPLVVADFWAVEEEPLSGLVLHAGLGELDLHGVCCLLACKMYTVREVLTVWVTDDPDDLSLPSAADFAVQAVHQVQATSKKLPSPALITDAMSPEVFFVERRVSRDGVANEAAGRMRVHAEQERNEQVVGVPESLERLLSDPVVGGGVDQQHA